jgi:hypothetical protein
MSTFCLSGVRKSSVIDVLQVKRPEKVTNTIYIKIKALKYPVETWKSNPANSSPPTINKLTTDNKPYMKRLVQEFAVVLVEY